MKRELFEKLTQWKNDPSRKPLILMGARQVGKTTLLKKFGAQCYKETLYINFELEPNLAKLFEYSLKPNDIIRSLEIEKDTKIIPHNTLLIFDEIQECPSALNSLKYFCELASDYAICAAGSLLGVKLMHTKGFPVGKVNFMHLYPLTFIEFLDALNEIKLKDYINDIKNIEPLFSNLHEKLIQYFKLYLIVGGMPEAVMSYSHSQDFNEVQNIHQSILNAYSLDFAKHAPPDTIMKITLVWNSIATQLSKENKKFIYSLLRKGARAKEFENALAKERDPSRARQLERKVAQWRAWDADRGVKAEDHGYRDFTLDNGSQRSALEELVRWRLWQRTGGGLMAELGSHQLDAASIFCSALRKDGKKAHPLTVHAVGGRHIFPLDRHAEDHVYCMFEFPGPAYEPDFPLGYKTGGKGVPGFDDDPNK
ncbi:MAG: AAA family ATPase, partial [Gammaproteobacteria bacterium]|nr:AAA family ATPase [Gammaproteobacteria bacterium]